VYKRQALGSARGGRNSEFQALLPIRGKILNVQKATPKQVLDNVECSAIIQVLGAGSGRTFDIDQMRYDRIILMTDADVEGSHIGCLLLTLFARLMRPVIEHGRLYAAMPPLHKVTTKGRNPITVYTYTQEEMERKVAEFTRAGKQIVTPIPRFKGLGEMDAEELDVTTMSPVTRSVRKITLNDAVAAEGTLELLMGNSVEPRRDFIIANSGNVDTETLDS
jgi:DNA gyrase subunit B